MTWNHRIIFTPAGVDMLEEDRYALHEVYYDNDGTPNGSTHDPVGVETETLAQFMKWTAHALEKPVLQYDKANKLVEKLPDA